MSDLFQYLDGLSPFVQGLLGSAIFALTSWLAQKAFKKAKSSGSLFLREYMKLDVVKHVLHHDYILSSDLQRASYGSAISLLFASRYVLIGILVLLFFFGINSLLNSSWLFLAASWFCFNSVLEAYRWVRDSSHEKNIEHVPDDIRVEMLTKLRGIPPPPKIEKNSNQ
jgi:hypothetical protein